MKRKQLIAIIMLVFMLLGTFFYGLFLAYSCVEESNTIGHEQYLSQIGELSQCISEEVKISVNQISAFRQMISKKSLISDMMWGVIDGWKAISVGFALTAFLVMSVGTANCSQKVIIHYIHNKDGQKA